MRLVVAAAAGAATGLWLLLTALFPARRPLASAIAQLHQPLQPARPTGRSRGAWGVLVAGVDRWVGRARGVPAALAVTGRTPDGFATTVTATALAGALTGPLAGLGFATLTGGGWWSYPAILLVAGAVAGGVVPFVIVRAEARRARRDFRHALGSWLDVVVLLIASGIGPESAMADAARSGGGPAFVELQRIIGEAAFGVNLWDAFDRGGQRLGVVELRELAAVAQLASRSGASIRDSLMTKARSLRGHLLAEQETAAAARGRMMFGPIVVIAFAFLTYLVYPLLANLRLPS